MEKQVSEGSLHKWFKGSKSKDGKGGWVNVVTGGTCASDENLKELQNVIFCKEKYGKAERLSAARTKRNLSKNLVLQNQSYQPTNQRKRK